ncbi:hypothetical protein JCM19992_26550 [Thermostilla marina]
MKIRTWYRLHRWLGIAIAVPIIVVAVTGILLVHAEGLGLKGSPEQIEKLEPTETHGRTFLDFRLQSGPDCVPTAIPVLETAEQAFRSRFGETPLNAIELKYEEEHGGWIVKIKTKRTSEAGESEFIWSLTQGCPIEIKKKPAVNWHKTVKELHDGKLLSRDWGFLWADLAAVSMLILSSTGLVLWLRIRAAKSHKKSAKNHLNGASAPREETQP